MWFKKLRTSIMFSFCHFKSSKYRNVWVERFVIIVTSLHRDYLPSSWTMFSPTFVDIGNLHNRNNRFLLCVVSIIARTFPVIAQAEIKTILKELGDNL